MSTLNTAVPRHTSLRAVNAIESGDVPHNAAPEILAAAIQAFDELEYEHATISHIAELAGTSKSLVTYFFPSKRAMAAAVIDLAYPGGVFMGVPRAVADPLDAIVWVAQHVTTNVLHSALARVAMRLVDQEISGVQRSAGKFIGWYTRLTDYLEEARLASLIPRTIDPTTEARYILCGVVGLIDVAMATGSQLSLVDDAVQITRDRIDILRRDR